MIRNKKEITTALEKEYKSFIAYQTGLSTDEFLFKHQSKWSAAQQLKHLVLSVKPLVLVFGMPTAVIEKNFGLAKAPSSTYNVLVNNYLEKLKEGGKAPSRFLPEPVSENEKTELLQTLATLVEQLIKLIEVFTEKELDTLGVPHPLLGTISLREMLFQAIYHVGHHQNLTEHYLKNK
jgi:hypothetical protein